MTLKLQRSTVEQETVPGTPIDAFRSGGHGQAVDWDAKPAFRSGGISSAGSPGFTLGDPLDEAKGRSEDAK